MACVARCVAVAAVATAVCCCWCYVCCCCRLTHGPTFIRNDSWPTVCVVCCLLCLFAVCLLFLCLLCLLCLFVCCCHRRARRVAGLVSRRWRAVVVWYVHVVTPCMCCVPVLYRRGLLLSCVCVCVCVCVCACLCLCVTSVPSCVGGCCLDGVVRCGALMVRAARPRSLTVLESTVRCM